MGEVIAPILVCILAVVASMTSEPRLSIGSNWTADEEEALLASLERALGVAGKARSSGHELFFQIIQIRDHQDQGLPELRDLVNLVKAIPALRLFNQGSPNFLGNCREINHLTLVSWLISRAQIVGVPQTVADLAAYLNTEALDVVEVLTIDGVALGESIEIADFTLVPWDLLPMTDTKWQIALRELYGGRLPTAALCRKHQIPALRASKPAPAPSPLPNSFESLFDVLRCITAAIGAGTRFLHHWVEPPDWAPWHVVQSTFGVDGSVFVMPKPISNSAAEAIDACASAFFGLDSSRQQRLRVPMDRLNRSQLAGQLRSVDAAIELGIAVESLFAPDKLSDGISYTVRTRAARFLSGSLQERQEVAKTLKDVYDLRSRAVHAGRFDADKNSKKWKDDADVRAALQNGQRIVGRSLVKLIHEGEPIWEEFDLEG